MSPSSTLNALRVPTHPVCADKFTPEHTHRAGTRSKSASPLAMLGAATRGSCSLERVVRKGNAMPGTVLQTHDLALVEFDEVRVPKSASRGVNLGLTAEVHGFPAAILAADEEAERRLSALFAVRVVSPVQQPAVLGYLVVVEQRLGSDLV